MTYLLDTNWLVSFLNGRAEAVELLEKRSLEGISVSIIVCGEVYEGFQQDHSSESRLVQFDKFLETVDLITLDRDIARVCAGLRSRLRSHGRMIPDNDIWIAARESRIRKRHSRSRSPVGFTGTARLRSAAPPS